MLVLNRKRNESVQVRDQDGNLIVTVTVVGSQTRLGFEAKPNVGILRTELVERREQACQKSTSTN